MWYIDSDWGLIREHPGSAQNSYHLLDELQIEEGLTSAQGPNPGIHSEGYPNSCVQRAKKKYGINKPFHYGEACYTLKEGGKMEKYLRVLLELGDIHDRAEMAKNPLDNFISKSSGVSFGYAHQAAGFRYHNNTAMRTAFYSNFVHSLASSSKLHGPPYGKRVGKRWVDGNLYRLKTKKG